MFAAEQAVDASAAPLLAMNLRLFMIEFLLHDAVLKSSQQLLRHPRRAQEPAALSAVFDFQARCHNSLFSSVIPALYLKFANVEEPVKNERLRSVGSFRHSIGIAGQPESTRRRRVALASDLRPAGL